MLRDHTPAPRRDVRRNLDGGFTLVELLVVIMIVAVLTLIALPAFFNQREKGQDSEAKLMLRTATTALHTFQVDNDTFQTDVATLVALEPSLTAARDLSVSGTQSTYQLEASSATGNVFTATRDATGKVTHTCSTPGTGLCRTSADPLGNWW